MGVLKRETVLTFNTRRGRKFYRKFTNDPTRKALACKLKIDTAPRPGICSCPITYQLITNYLSITYQLFIQLHRDVFAYTRRKFSIARTTPTLLWALDSRKRARLPCVAPAREACIWRGWSNAAWNLCRTAPQPPQNHV